MKAVGILMNERKTVMNSYEKCKLSEKLIANAIADIGALYDLELTAEETHICLNMIIELQKINSRITREMKFEYESIM